MADQKKWFKVWTSILADDDFDCSTQEGRDRLARFVWLGAYAALLGENGQFHVNDNFITSRLGTAEIAPIRAQLECKNVSFEEGQNSNGKIIVTIKKWRKFQEDQGVARRQKEWRERQRNDAEEKRGDERRRDLKESKDSFSATPEKVSGSAEWPAEDRWLQDFVKSQDLVPVPPDYLLDLKWWISVGYGVNGLNREFVNREFGKMGAWIRENTGRKPASPRGWKRFIRCWLEKAYDDDRRRPKRDT